MLNYVYILNKGDRRKAKGDRRKATGERRQGDLVTKGLRNEGTKGRRDEGTKTARLARLARLA
jgi:hypothetical protein